MTTQAYFHKSAPLCGRRWQGSREQRGKLEGSMEHGPPPLTEPHPSYILVKCSHVSWLRFDQHVSQLTNFGQRVTLTLKRIWLTFDQDMTMTIVKISRKWKVNQLSFDQDQTKFSLAQSYSTQKKFSRHWNSFVIHVLNVDPSHLLLLIESLGTSSDWYVSLQDWPEWYR